MEFKVPLITNNEDDVEIIDIYIKNGDYVKKDQKIFLIETTKTSTEIESEVEGYIYFNFQKKDRILCGDQFYEVLNKPFKKKEVQNKNELKIITLEAKKIILEKKIKITDINANIIDKKVILDYLKSSNNFKKEIIPNGGKDSLLIVGCSMHGMVVHDVVKKINTLNPIAFIDYSNVPNENKVFGLNIYQIDDLEEFFKKGTQNIHINTNNYELTKNIFTKAKKIGFKIVNVIHPSADIAISANLGECIFVGAQAIIGTNVTIGSFSKILNKASVAHDSIIGNNVQVSDGATIAGNVTVEDNVLIGINSGVINKCKISSNSTILSGKIVTKNVGNGTIYND